MVIEVTCENFTFDYELQMGPNLLDYQLSLGTIDFDYRLSLGTVLHLEHSQPVRRPYHSVLTLTPCKLFCEYRP